MDELQKPALSEVEARTLTDNIRQTAANLWSLVLTAWDGRAWEALGYETWQDYCKIEFDADHLALPKSERTRVFNMLKKAGMSTRAIAAATNVSHTTVERGTNVPATESETEETDSDAAFIAAFIKDTARGIYRFAGTSDYQECVAMREGLQRALKRLDSRIKTLHPKES